MSHSRICLIAILLFAFGVGVNGQQMPKSVLVDEFDSVPCGDLLGRTDAFFAELGKHPADAGLVIIFPNAKNPTGYRAWINANTYYRRFDRNRLNIVVATKPSGTDAVAQFWRVPPGSSTPEFESASKEPRDLSKPFIFGYEDENGVCPSFNPSDFANAINQNSGSFGKVVVRGSTRHNRKSLADSVVRTLLGEGISRARLRIFYVHQPKNVVTEAEIWFIPANK